MCMMCNGATRREVHEHFRQQVDNKGYALCAVSSGREGEDTGWAYTIGLLHGSGHPELVAAGPRLSIGAVVVDEIATRVVRGERFRARASTNAMGISVGFVEVSHVQIRHGLMDAWLSYYDAEGVTDSGPGALQVLLPDGQRCFEHQITQPRLDIREPAALIRPDRAARRSARDRTRTSRH